MIEEYYGPSYEHRQFLAENLLFTESVRYSQSLNTTKVLGGLAFIDMLAQRAHENNPSGFGLSEIEKYQVNAINIYDILRSNDEGRLEPSLTSSQIDELNVKRSALVQYLHVLKHKGPETLATEKNFYNQDQA